MKSDHSYGNGFCFYGNDRAGAKRSSLMVYWLEKSLAVLEFSGTLDDDIYHYLFFSPKKYIFEIHLP